MNRFSSTSNMSREAATTLNLVSAIPLRSTQMQVVASTSRPNVPATVGDMGHPTEARTPYTSNVMSRGAIAPTNMRSEAPYVSRAIPTPMRQGMDSAVSSISLNGSRAWDPAVTSAAPTMASVSDFNMIASLTPEGAAHFGAPPNPGPIRDPRLRPRVMPLEARAPVLGAGGLDVCFVMDCTSSMAPWLEAAKTTVKDMIAALPTDVPIKRIAFVGYRDFGDGPAQVQRFTEDTESIIRFIDAQDATGGADIPEDVAGGLAAALGLDWRSETRTLVLVTDAPCHGKKYHNELDDYSDGDPTGLSMVRLVRALRQSHIDLTMVQLTSKTDKMQKMLKMIYENAAGPENIRKYELRDLRGIIEDAGGETALSSNPSATIQLLSAAVTPTVQASIGSTQARSPMLSVPMPTAMNEVLPAPLSAPAFHRGARTTEVY